MVGADKYVGNALKYKIYDPSKGQIVARSLIWTADPKRGAVTN